MAFNVVFGEFPYNTWYKSILDNTFYHKPEYWGFQVEVLNEGGNIDPDLTELGAERGSRHRHLGRNCGPQSTCESVFRYDDLTFFVEIDLDGYSLFISQILAKKSVQI